MLYDNKQDTSHAYSKNALLKHIPSEIKILKTTLTVIFLVQLALTSLSTHYIGHTTTGGFSGKANQCILVGPDSVL